MSKTKGLELTFDTVASAYEKFRPSYPDKLYETIFSYVTLDESSYVVEVGTGGGQATLPFLKTRCNLTAIECGKELSKLCEKKFKKYPNFSVITNKFEDTPFGDNKYDLVYSATAFHWIDESIGYKKVFSMLKSGGVFARFANHTYPAKDNLPLFEEIQSVYGEHFHNKKQKMPTDYTEEQAKQIAKIAVKYGFVDIKHALFYRTRCFCANEYCSLLGTYSDHIAIEETLRKKFFLKIENVINKHGGTITVYDTIDLQLARKP